MSVTSTCVAALVVVGLGVSPDSDALESKEGATFRIVGFRAYLYYHETGALSVDDVLAGTVDLRNVFIGGGGSPSVTMLVLTEVSGPDFGRRVPKGTSLRMVAKSGGRQLASATLSLRDYISNGTRIFLPLLVSGVSCETVEITAHLAGFKQDIPARSATVPFAYGE
jgi:hypothetical protein